jgi:beta-1,4-mannosyl-glycoprotein beta-1,4-N-acetylglucosaminyltransferase
MKIYDCFTYFNEDLILDMRLNILNKYVDYFVIVEGNKTHSGKAKKKNFQIEKFQKFKKKIKYFFIEDMPKTNNSWELENFQRNQIELGLEKANKEDLIVISDCDEIPNLKEIKNINTKEFNKNIFVFEQKCFYYKLNLLNPKSNPWHGTKLVRYDFLKKFTPQKIRSYKTKQYPFWRIDKPKNVIIIKNGGWHFSFLNNLNNIKLKLRSYAHTEFNKKIFLNNRNLLNKLKNYKDLFDESISLKKIDLDNSYPYHIIKNKKKFKEWIVS